MTVPPQDEYYNAWEEDIAVVNIFFGKDTVMGEKMSVLLFHECSFQRTGAKHQDGTGGLHCLPWRALWPLPWVQHHLLPRDYLLGSHWLLQECFQQVIGVASSSSFLHYNKITLHP